MKKRLRVSAWAKTFERSFVAMSRMATASGSRALAKALQPVMAKRTPPPSAGAWIPGDVMGASGARRFQLYRPSGVKFGERLPLMVMLHGCGQDANSFASSTRMNRIAMRERFLVLYAEQECWRREAPYIAGSPKLDATDLYMFRSYKTGRQNFVTILANYMPFQDPQGGPNFHMFSPEGLYEIHIDNNGDGVEDITFQFRFTNTSKATALTVGGKAVKIPLINSGVIAGINPAALNVRETFTIDVLRSGRRTARSSVTNAAGGATMFDKPVDNIGDKVFGSATGYATYSNQHIYDVVIPGCTTPGRVFVGQRKEPFYIAVGRAFDLFNLNPLGAEIGGNNNDLKGKNVSTLAMELPISCLTAGTDPVIGAFTTASLRQGRLLDGSPATGLGKVARSGGAWTQVSRPGMPLVNELIIGIDDKDKFNASKPKNDAANFAD